MTDSLDNELDLINRWIENLAKQQAQPKPEIKLVASMGYDLSDEQLVYKYDKVIL